MSLTASYLLEVSVRHIHGVDPGVDSFMDYLHILNDHEPPIRFKYVIHARKRGFIFI